MEAPQMRGVEEPLLPEPRAVEGGATQSEGAIETQEARYPRLHKTAGLRALDVWAEISNGSLLQQGVAGALMVVPSGGVAMTKRVPVELAPGPLEDYAQSFDDLFANRAQREGFRRYLEGLLLPEERNKTLTALANTEPVAGAQRKEAQSLQWFLTESSWDAEEV